MESSGAGILTIRRLLEIHNIIDIYEFSHIIDAIYCHINVIKVQKSALLENMPDLSLISTIFMMTVSGAAMLRLH